MDLTVAICTHNRAALLDQTLHSIGRLRVPDELAWEVVVINNNSTDNTDSIVSKHISLGIIPLKRGFEPELGIGNARHCALAMSQGKYIVWTDDDVVVEDGWLCAYLDAFRKWPDASFFGGKVIPQLEEPIPDWIKESWRTVPIVPTVFACRDYGDEPLRLSIVPRRIPVGANCAIRVAIHKEYGSDRRLGVRGKGRNISAEDSYLFENLLRDGHIGYWVPSAQVTHCIPQSRQTIRALKEHCLALGRGDAFRDRHSKASRLFGVPRWLWRRTLVSGLLYFFYRLTSRRRVWLAYYVDYFQDRGGLDYWLNCRDSQEP